MDQQQPVQPMQPTPLPMKPSTKQGDSTKWVVLILFIFATLGTGVAYLMFTKPSVKQLLYLAPSTPSPSPTTAKNTGKPINSDVWQKYTNAQHNYSFAYTGAWTVSTPSDKGDFVLRHISTSHPGTIEGTFLPANNRTQGYCEKNRSDTARCEILQVTKTREIFVDKTDYDETGKISLLILSPTRDAIEITITGANFETTSAIDLILTTITFTDEGRTIKLADCPTSWSPDRQTAVIRGAKFDVKDLDGQFITKYCSSLGTSSN